MLFENIFHGLVLLKTIAFVNVAFRITSENASDRQHNKLCWYRGDPEHLVLDVESIPCFHFSNTNDGLPLQHICEEFTLLLRNVRTLGQKN